MINDKSSKKELAADIFCVGSLILVVFLLFRYALGVILPFAVAYTLSLVIAPMSARLSHVTKLPKKLISALLVTVFVGALCALAYFGVSRLIGEVAELIDQAANGEGLLVMIQARLKNSDVLGSLSVFLEKMSRIEIFSVPLGELVSDLADDALSSMSEALASGLGSVIRRAPSILLSTIVTLVACYLFSMDSEGFISSIKRCLPGRATAFAKKVRTLVSSALKSYARSYLLLMLLTFTEVFIGLSVMSVRYSFLIALAIATVDVLPVLGAGAVLLPWALISFLISDTSLAIGLLILYAIITVVRQFAEARIVGSGIGLHPLITLFSMYAGLRFFGVSGMILAPIAAFVFIELKFISEKTNKKEQEILTQKAK